MLKGQVLHVVAVLDPALNNETVRSNIGRRRPQVEGERCGESCTVDNTVNTVFHCESYGLLLVLPAGGVFQTEPPGGCLRQAVEFGSYFVLWSRGNTMLLISVDPSSQILHRESVRIHCVYTE